MSQALIDSVNTLSTQTTDLLNEYKDAKQNIDGKVASASTDAATATTKANEASASALAAASDRATAKSEADRAKQEADTAAAVVTGGTATVTPEPGKIPLANFDGKVDAGWLDAISQHSIKQAVRDALRAQNNERFKASGFVHMGKHSSNSGHPNVNQGLWCIGGGDKVLTIGNDGGDEAGESETLMPVVNITGIETKLEYLNAQHPSLKRGAIKFPAAERGTRVYDSADGSSIDYATDVDPKYGDIAVDDSEAVARAFEGLAKNGDFRLGDNGDWNTTGSGENGSITISSSGVYFDGTHISASCYFNSNNLGLVEGTEYLIEFTVTEYSGGDVRVNFISGGTVSDYSIAKKGRHSFTKTATTGDNVFNINHRSAGNTLRIIDISVRPTTQQIVTKRQDLYGLEAWLEEVNSTNPFVYYNGIPQSQATDIEGIATTTSNRPDSYYAAYDGDTGSKGKSVNFFALTFAEQCKILANPDHNLWYLDDGRLVQWRVKQLTIRGKGDGSWFNVDSTTDFLRFDDNGMATGVEPQGIKDSSPEFRDSAYSLYLGKPSESFVRGGSIGKGVFRVRQSADGANDTDYGVNGECYFLVLGTCSRLNQGAYHPALNPAGASQFWRNTGGGISDWNGSGLAGLIKTQKDCFNYHLANNYGAPTVTGSVAAGQYDGSIGSDYSGRPDGRFYDGIYSGGLGGVVDRRLSAWGKSLEDGWEVDAKVKAGTYRGLEPMMITNHLIFDQSGTDGSNTYVSKEQISGHNELADNAGLVFHNGYAYQLERHANTYWVRLKRFVAGVATAGDWSADIDLNKPFVFIPSNGNRLDVALTAPPCSEINTINVSGEFIQIDIIASPENLLATFPEGIPGAAWIPTIPDGSSVQWNDLTATRKRLATGYLSKVQTDDNGATWVASTHAWDGENNTPSATSLPPVTRVEVWTYTAWAKMTKESTNRPVRGGRSGIGDVWAGCYFDPDYGGTLIETLIGKVATSNLVNQHQNLLLNQYVISPYTGLLNPNAAYQTAHTELSIGAPANSSSAVKALTYQFADGDQAQLGFHAKEMMWDTSLDEIAEFVTRNSATSYAYSKNTYYYFNAGAHSGLVFQFIANSQTFAIDDSCYMADDGNLYYKSTNGLMFKRFTGNGWGDDNTIPIGDGSELITDDNGNSVIRTCHELALPFGWV